VVAIVVLNYNGLDDTVRCLTSLGSITYPDCCVILVDNGSGIDPAAEARRAYPGVEVIHTGSNLGYAGGNNRGISRALERGADYILILNNDTIVDPQLVTALIEAFAANPSLGIAGPVINFMDEPNVVMTEGVVFNPGPGTEFFHAQPVPTDSPSPALVDVDIVNGCCLMVRADVVRAIGGFDERMFIVHEESDFCLRAAAAGFRCAVLGRTLVWHKGSSSFDRSGRQLQRYFDTRNLYYLLRRHSGRVGRSRGQLESIQHYFRYAFYRYSHEIESNKPEAARAVADGLWDALCGRYGSYVQRRRAGGACIGGLFRTMAGASSAK
jgi:GT2 family glycosyltransferase